MFELKRGSFRDEEGIGWTRGLTHKCCLPVVTYSLFNCREGDNPSISSRNVDFGREYWKGENIRGILEIVFQWQTELANGYFPAKLSIMTEAPSRMLPADFRRCLFLGYIFGL